MKKILLAALALIATATTALADKTVTFDFSKPADYGYAAPSAEKDHQETPLAVGDKITAGDVSITVVAIGSTATRFWNTSGEISLRLYSGCSVAIEAGGANIKSIAVTGSSVSADNITADPGTWGDKTWTGSASKVTLARAKGSVTMKTMTVTYEGSSAGSPTVETFEACTTEISNWEEKTDDNGNKSWSCTATTTANEPFASATVADGKSVVNFGTDNMDVEGVAGARPTDVFVDAGVDFPGWTAGYETVEWKKSNRNIDDKRKTFFGWIQGTGNPYTKLEAEEVLDNDQRTGHYRGKYTTYLPDGSNGMPVTGVYYKFQPKASGLLKVQVWANKGNQNTFVVEESSKLPVAYKAEGYINGQTEEDPAGKNMMRYLSNDDIVALHTAAKVTDGVDSAPYVIGAGNQPFFGYITFSVEQGKKYWMFQDKSQIGFGGYEFTVGGTDGIAEIPASQPKASTGRTYNIAGQAVGASFRGIVIRDGKKVVVK